MRQLKFLGEVLIGLGWAALIVALMHWSMGLAWVGLAIWLASIGAKFQEYAKARAVTLAVADVARIQAGSGDVFFAACERRCNTGFAHPDVEIRRFFDQHAVIGFTVESGTVSENKALVVLARPHQRLQK